jgi:hypothetical protein
MPPLLILLQVKTFIKIIQVAIISSVKFIFAPPVSIEMGFSYFETIATTTAGGIIGVFFFYHLSGWLLKMFRKHLKPIFYRLFKFKKNKPETVNVQENKPAKNGIFTWKSKLFYLVRNKWGLIGICILTPTIFSIPIGAFLANKYYSKNKNTLVFLCISVVFWSFLVSTIYFYSF